MAKDADTHNMLQQVIRTDQYGITIYNTNPDLSERLADELQQWEPGRTEFTTQACAFSPKNTERDGSLSVELSWTARDGSSKSKLPGKVGYYNINGALGEANDVITKLRVQCDLAGKLRKPSSQVSLVADASNTLNIGTKVDPKTIDQQITILYLMTRKATEVLDCENNPLKKDPVVKSYTTPEEAAQAGS
ncbi:hypothetical protein [Streptomyces scopuliridis]|uniref:hypothetical protein n=1 Tax=Streptomyces scopuliridis TaxID=452529 RepID=UPI003688F9EC